jgi:hypothetical protein
MALISLSAKDALTGVAARMPSEDFSLDVVGNQMMESFLLIIVVELSVDAEVD